MLPDDPFVRKRFRSKLISAIAVVKLKRCGLPVSYVRYNAVVVAYFYLVKTFYSCTKQILLCYYSIIGHSKFTANLKIIILKERITSENTDHKIKYNINVMNG